MKNLFALGIATICLSSYAQNDSVIFSDLRASDQAIIKYEVIYLNVKDRESCFKDKDKINCLSVRGLWANGLGKDSEGQKYLSSLENKPPHIKEQILKEDFLKRYQQLLPYKDREICFGDYTWNWTSLKDGTAYFFGTEKRLSDNYLLFTFNENLVLRNNEKIL